MELFELANGYAESYFAWLKANNAPQLLWPDGLHPRGYKIVNDHLCYRKKKLGALITLKRIGDGDRIAIRASRSQLQLLRQAEALRWKLLTTRADKLLKVSHDILAWAKRLAGRLRHFHIVHDGVLQRISIKGTTNNEDCISIEPDRTNYTPMEYLALVGCAPVDGPAIYAEIKAHGKILTRHWARVTRVEMLMVAVIRDIVRDEKLPPDGFSNTDIDHQYVQVNGRTYFGTDRRTWPRPGIYVIDVDARL